MKTRTINWLMLTVAMGLSEVPGITLAQDVKPVFYLTFDQESTLNIQELQGKLEYGTGIVGKALYLSPNTNLIYKTEGNLNLSEGTISMWIKPLNWNGADENGYSFIGFRDKDMQEIGGWSKHHQTTTMGLTLYLAGENPKWKGMNTDPKPLSRWMQNTWHHIVLTYNKDLFAIYVDNIMVGYSKDALAMELWNRLQNVRYFTVGGTYAGTNLRTAFDEIAIYNIALSSEQISRLFQKIAIKLLD